MYSVRVVVCMESDSNVYVSYGINGACLQCVTYYMCASFERSVSSVELVVNFLSLSI